MMENGKVPGFSPWFLESAIAGELPPEEMEKFRSAVVRDPELAKAVEALRTSNQAILNQHPPLQVEREVRRRAAGARKASRSQAYHAFLDFFHGFLTGRARFPLLLSAAAACLLMLVIPRTGSPDPDDVRVKGDSLSLYVYRQVGQRAERLEAGGYVRPRERLQVYLKAPTGNHAAVFALDGRGGTTQLWPPLGDAPPRVGKQDKISLPNSYELDDAPAFERIFLVSSPKNFRISDAMRAAARLFENSKTACCADLDLPREFRQSSVLLLKKSGS